ncbi:hypothetical protein [Allorhizocola rhizosphaerae]|uniref:hypothetical protein n=1 Tax=Allorhizocola rhizosphaerae TaxID=1872709 RepID=UPI000E3E3AA6|nr:hypothetical protein [Allorhizocola rhizosphaerae]
MPEIVFVERPRKRKWPWVLGIIGTLCVLCSGLCLAATIPLREQWPARIAAMPDELAGLRRERDPLVNLVAAAAEREIRNEQIVDDAFAAMYGDPKSKDRQVLVFGATLLILDPPGELKKAIAGAGKSISEVTPFDEGISCANGKDDKDKPIVVCAWIDHGSMGVGLFYGARSMPASAAWLRALRNEIILRP